MDKQPSVSVKPITAITSAVLPATTSINQTGQKTPAANSNCPKCVPSRYSSKQQIHVPQDTPLKSRTVSAESHVSVRFTTEKSPLNFVQSPPVCPYSQLSLLDVNAPPSDVDGRPGTYGARKIDVDDIPDIDDLIAVLNTNEKKIIENLSTGNLSKVIELINQQHELLDRQDAIQFPPQSRP